MKNIFLILGFLLSNNIYSQSMFLETGNGMCFNVGYSKLNDISVISYGASFTILNRVEFGFSLNDYDVTDYSVSYHFIKGIFNSVFSVHYSNDNENDFYGYNLTIYFNPSSKSNFQPRPSLALGIVVDKRSKSKILFGFELPFLIDDFLILSPMVGFADDVFILGISGGVILIF